MPSDAVLEWLLTATLESRVRGAIIGPAIRQPQVALGGGRGPGRPPPMRFRRHAGEFFTKKPAMKGMAFRRSALETLPARSFLVVRNVVFTPRRFIIADFANPPRQ